MTDESAVAVISHDVDAPLFPGAERLWLGDTAEQCHQKPTALRRDSVCVQ